MHTRYARMGPYFGAYGHANGAHASMYNNGWSQSGVLGYGLLGGTS